MILWKEANETQFLSFLQHQSLTLHIQRQDPKGRSQFSREFLHRSLLSWVTKGVTFAGSYGNKQQNALVWDPAPVPCFLDRCDGEVKGTETKHQDELDWEDILHCGCVQLMWYYSAGSSYIACIVWLHTVQEHGWEAQALLAEVQGFPDWLCFLLSSSCHVPGLSD